MERINDARPAANIAVSVVKMMRDKQSRHQEIRKNRTISPHKSRRTPESIELTNIRTEPTKAVTGELNDLNLLPSPEKLRSNNKTMKLTTVGDGNHEQEKSRELARSKLRDEQLEAIQKAKDERRKDEELEKLRRDKVKLERNVAWHNEKLKILQQQADDR